MDSPARFRKKPIEIEAILWTGHNAAAVKAFVGTRDNGVARFLLPNESPLWEGAWEGAQVWIDVENQWVGVTVGDWIIKGVQGEYYPCAPSVFAETYEPV